MSQAVPQPRRLCKEKNAPPDPVVLIPRTEARRQASISRSTENRLLSEPDSGWPRPVPIGPSKSGYVQSEITQWIGRRVAARDHGAVGLSTKERQLLSECLGAPWHRVRRHWPWLRNLRHRAEPLPADDKARLATIHRIVISDPE